MKRSKEALLAWLLMACSTASLAHEGRPLHVQVDEQAADTYLVSWRTPATVAADNAPDVLLPQSCARAGPRVAIRVLDQQALYRCPAGFGGGRITIAYPQGNPSLTTLIRFNRLNGERRLAVLNPEQTSWAIPAAENASTVAVEYLGFGVDHILGGYDHLLFVACLIFIARTPRRILITVTGFTVAHSITLALSALDWLRLATPPIEASIALSIVFVASEIARGQRATLTWRYPIAVSSSFGLLHGLGFAAVLRDIGLPQTELPTALLFFNVGVEIGQIVFVAGLLLLGVVAARVSGPGGALEHGRVQQLVAYAVGCLAVFWTLQRVALFAG
jgi:hypothetical protein